MHFRRIATILAIAAALWLVADVALACPTCKDQLAGDPAAANIVRGYFWSILFMLSMPYLIFLGLGSYFYWQVRQAQARQAAASAQNPSPEMQLAPLPAYQPELAEVQ